MHLPRHARTRRTVRSGAVVASALVALALGLAGCNTAESPPSASIEAADSTTTRSGGDAAAAGERIVIGADEALVWGDGPNGIVLAHGSAFDAASWQAQAVPMAALGYTVVAVENTGTAALEAAIAYLRDDRGVEHVTLIGGSSGADSILALLSERPELSNSLILLSPNRTVGGLDGQPKLFIASADEPLADVSSELADTAPGDDNVALILPGRAHAQNIFDSDQGQVATDAILDRLRQLPSG